MRFKSVPTAEAAKLVKSFEDTKRNYTNLNKGANKLMKAKEISKAEKELKDWGAKASKRMVDDLGQVRTNFEQHAKGIQEMMIQCAKFLATAEGAVKRFEAAPTPFESNQVRAITARAVEEIKAKLVTAQDQDTDYGEAWWEYRQYNPMTHGLDAEYAKKAADMKTALMNDGKPVTAKIKSMEALQEKVQTLVNR